ncbi:MAG: BON domain-containing protein [Actinomycetota bacterium]|nr:BON domain-containing protein [Actinomycetota bacterium]
MATTPAPDDGSGPDLASMRNTFANADARLSRLVARRLQRDLAEAGGAITVVAEHEVVVLIGSAVSPEVRLAAGRAARETDGVRDVHNMITVAEPDRPRRDDQDKRAFDDIAARLEAEMSATRRQETAHNRGVRTALVVAAGALWAALTVLGLAAGWGVVLVVGLAAAVAIETYYDWRHPRRPVRADAPPWPVGRTFGRRRGP